MLTALPLGARWPEQQRPDVAGYFPLAGVLVGGAGVAVPALAHVLDLPSSPGGPVQSVLLAAVVLAVWGFLTRLLHWDALADVADAYWGSEDPQVRRDIMSDSRTGAFGATSVALIALLEVSALGVLIGAGAFTPILVAVALSRYAAVFGAWFGEPAKATGLGASVAGPPRPPSGMAAGLVLAFIGVLAFSSGMAALAVAGVCILLALGIPHLIAARFGGITGDVLGAGVLLTETAGLVLFALVW